jgi:hypothetical protein
MTSDETSNVVAFAPRTRKEEEAPPDLQFVELRLTETCGLEMTVVDMEGNTFMLTYRLAELSEGFHVDRLARAWEGWRGCCERAS